LQRRDVITHPSSFTSSGTTLNKSPTMP
jgi:hypothetical protein